MARHRNLNAYTMHARALDAVANYPEFFSFLESLQPSQRQVTIQDRLVAITSVGGGGELYRLRFVQGDVGVPPLTFDPSSGLEQSEDIGRRVLVNPTWGFFDPEARIAAIERRRPGVPAPVIANALSQIARQTGFANNFTFSLNPVADQTFLSELDRYERIREADIEVARPNYDWSDNTEQLTAYAEESDAGSAIVSMKAQRGGTLSQTHGIVADIKNLVASKFSPLKNARVVGQRASEERETTLSLSRHLRRRVATIPDGSSSEVEADILAGVADDLITETVEAADESSVEQ